MTAPAWSPPRLIPNQRTVAVTRRQAQILTAWCEGMTDEAIGHRHHITVDTVKTTGRRLRRALGAVDRTHAVALACSGWVRIAVVDARGLM